MTDTSICPHCNTPMPQLASFCPGCGSRLPGDDERVEQLDLEKFFNHALDMCCIAGVDGFFKRVNPAFERTLGYSTTELLARPFSELIHPDDRPGTAAEVGKLTDGAPTLSFENRFRCKDGSYRDLHWTSFPEPGTGLLYAIARDVTERRQREDRVDRLTGVASRRYFERLLDEEWRRAFRLKVNLAVALIDVDQFKAYNTAYSHQMGDQRLREMAQLILQHVRRTGDAVTRYDGQEFALILAGGVNSQEAAELCERIRASIDGLSIPHSEAEPHGHLTVSIGTASLIPNAESAPSLLVGAADSALRSAKKQGGNRVERSHS